MASKIKVNDIRLEASMLPQAANKGTSQKTNSTTSGSQSSGDRPIRPPASSHFSSGSGVGSVSDDCWSSENGSAHEEDTDSRRRVQSGLQKQKAEVPPSDDKVSSQDNQSTLDAQSSIPDDNLSTKFASIFQDGPAYSVGSAGHPNDCQPCVHYCFSKRRGCNRGDECTFCHSFHESKLQQKRQRWKGNKKPLSRQQPDSMVEIQRGQVLKLAAHEQSGGEQLPVPKLAYADADLAPQPLVAKLAYTITAKTLQFGEPMIITPGNVGPYPGGSPTDGARARPLPPPGLDTALDEFPYSSFVCA